ncbi:hypothetical protein [Streptomyces meridianus]|uniref:Lipoprotein n=1 Tax=Streptomyces meridianus TaxID=2938945 RepID=A0ABT0X9V9_9ACTN|nr:hypothetical protein [Streptomyces meridianus]MCM2579306.1 hypothetical protein [Streptomyces meridianus]
MNRITTKPQRKTVLRAAAVVGAAVLGLTATACGGNDDDASKVSEASFPAASSSAPRESEAAPTASAQDPSGAPSGEEEASDEAAPSDSAAPRPFVLSQDEEPQAKEADRRPDKLVLSEFTTVDRITWTQWREADATGTGDVTGTWCLETCQDKPLKGTVTLSDPKTVNGKRYFSAYTLQLADGTKKTYETEDLNGKRQLATP